jgi:hypothetical protein
MSTSIVEYEGFLTSGAATLTPAFRFDTPNFSLGAQGSWTVFESGNQIYQATAAAAWLTQLHSRWRIEFSGAAGASQYASSSGSAHLLSRGRLHYASEQAGGWLSATTGATVNGSAEAPFELSLGMWSVRNRFALVATLTSTSIGDSRHIDVLGAARWTGPWLELEARLGARPWTDSDGGIGEARAGAYGEVSALVPFGGHVALALSAGNYPSDPVRRVLAAKYLTAGLRLSTASSRSEAQPLIAVAHRATARDHASSENTTEPRIEIALSGEPRTFRVHAAAKTMELMGDFTDWQAVTMKQIGAALWEVKLAVSPGTHRLNIRMDGGEWLVPAGARTEAGEFGGVVGVVVIR